MEGLSKSAKEYKAAVRAMQKKSPEQGTDAFDREYFRVSNAQDKVPTSKKRNKKRAGDYNYGMSIINRLVRKKKS